MFMFDVSEMEYIRGNGHAKRALEVSIAGGHNIALLGAGGSGKTMLAKEYAFITEKLDEKVLFLNTENNYLKSPLAAAEVLIYDDYANGVPRVEGLVNYMQEHSNQVIVITGRNCPCGPKKDRVCICSEEDKAAYTRLYRALYPHIAIWVEMSDFMTVQEALSSRLDETAYVIIDRIEAARKAQEARFGTTDIVNAFMGWKAIYAFCKLDKGGEDLLSKAVSQMVLNMSEIAVILRLARTIADLNGQANISAAHVAESIQYRRTKF